MIQASCPQKTKQTKPHASWKQKRSSRAQSSYICFNMYWSVWLCVEHVCHVCSQASVILYKASSSGCIRYSGARHILPGRGWRARATQFSKCESWFKHSQRGLGPYSWLRGPKYSQGGPGPLFQLCINIFLHICVRAVHASNAILAQASNSKQNCPISVNVALHVHCSPCFPCLSDEGMMKRIM